MNLTSSTIRALGTAVVGLFLVVGAVVGANGIGRAQPSTTSHFADPTHLTSPLTTSAPTVDPRIHDSTERDAHETADPTHALDRHAAADLDQASPTPHQTDDHDADADHASDHRTVHDAELTEAHESMAHDGESHQ